MHFQDSFLSQEVWLLLKPVCAARCSSFPIRRKEVFVNTWHPSYGSRFAFMTRTLAPPKPAISLRHTRHR